MEPTADILVRLERIIAQRRRGAHDTSYVASLNARGLSAIACKVGEEAVETVVASLTGSREEVVGEAADLLFHLLVLLGSKDVALADVLTELERREGVSGLAEKAARST